MAELTILIEQQGKEIRELKTMVYDLTRLVMRDKIDNTWISEKDAAEMIGYENPRTLRKKVKAMEGGFADIDCRNTNGRNWQYSRKSIIRFRNNSSS